MAQFNKLFQTMLGNNEDIYEVQMLADQNGNIINTFGDASNIPISAGLVEGYSVIHKFGLVDGTNTGNLSTVWAPADTAATILYPWDFTPSVLTAVSSSGDDTAAGAGAQTVFIEGLDSNYLPITDTFTMSGLTPTAAGTTVFSTVHRAYVLTGDTNVGKIQFKNSDDVVIADIHPGYGQTLMAIYTVPAGKTAYLSNFRVSSAKQQSTIVRLMVRNLGGVFRVRSTISLFSGNGETKFASPLRIPEKSNIEARITGGTNNTVSCDFDMVLIDN